MGTQEMEQNPRADRAAIMRTLDALFPHHPVVELHCPDYPRRHTASAGYFNDYEALADEYRGKRRVAGRC